MALILAIETSNPSNVGAGGPGVALAPMDLAWIDAEPLRLPEPGRRGSGHDDDLMPAIQRLMSRRALTPRDLAGGRLAVSIGPGGFTGLRIACNTGKMIAEAVGAACVAVPSALVVARGAMPRSPDGARLAVALASKGDSAWVQVFDRATDGLPAAAGPGRVMTGAELSRLSSDGVSALAADRYLPEPIRSAAEALEMVIAESAFDPRECLRAALSIPPIDPVQLVPLYPREPEAVTIWKQRAAGQRP